MYKSVVATVLGAVAVAALVGTLIGIAACTGKGGSGVHAAVPPVASGDPCPLTQALVSSTATTQLKLTVGRNTGVAPLMVFFDTAGTTSTATSRPFHEIEYQWNFGDATSGNWGYGSRVGTSIPSSRNLTTGPVAAHVYETAGTKTVTITDSTGSTFACTITVDDPDIIFATPNTYCLSNTAPAGNFFGCPVGVLSSQQIYIPAAANDFVTAISTYKAPGRRLLFGGGENWTVNAQPVINSAGPGILGRFGSGKVNLSSNAANDGNCAIKFSTTGNPANDWRVMDFSISSTTANSDGICGFHANTTQITILRVDITNVSGGISFSDGELAYAHDQIAIVDSTITELRNTTGVVGAYLGVSRLAMMGNYLDNNQFGEHVLRTPYVNKGVISNNTLRRAHGSIGYAGAKHVIKLHGPDYGLHPVYTELVVISDNDINNLSGDPGASFLVNIGPGNPRPERIRDVIVERNWFRTANLGVAVFIAGESVTGRNNLFDFTGTTGDHSPFFIQRNASAPVPNLIAIYNNTITTPDAVVSGSFRLVRIADTVSTNITIANNLGYAPLAVSPGVVVDSGAAGPVTISNNSSVGQIGTSPSFTVNPPVVPDDYRPVCTTLYPCAQGTLVPVWSDFFGRALPTPRDIGALVH